VVVSNENVNEHLTCGGPEEMSSVRDPFFFPPTWGKRFFYLCELLFSLLSKSSLEELLLKLVVFKLVGMKAVLWIIFFSLFRKQRRFSIVNIINSQQSLSILSIQLVGLKIVFLNII